jgi:hypothetical protein
MKQAFSPILIQGNFPHPILLFEQVVISDILDIFSIRVNTVNIISPRHSGQISKKKNFIKQSIHSKAQKEIFENRIHYTTYHEISHYFTTRQQKSPVRLRNRSGLRSVNKTHGTRSKEHESKTVQSKRKLY